MRVAIGGISHESSTFTNVATTLDSFRERSYLHGAAIVERFTGVNTPIGGFIEGAEAHGFEAVPTMLAEAHPSAPTPRPIFDRLVGELLDGIEAAGAIDGVLLELHGAMVAEGIDDAEGHILAAVRHLVGPDMPIVGQLDIHSNVSHAMIETADVLIGRETYPEVDMAPRGRECADVLVSMVREGVRPTMALHQLPLVWGMNQVTAHPPMRQAIEYLHRIEARPGVICGSIATCFPLADIPDMGASVYVATDNDPDLAQACTDELAAWVWERRADWQAPMPSTAEALQEADKAGHYPVVLADRNDNTGGGSPGDSTGLLQTFLAADLQDACVLYIVDPRSRGRLPPSRRRFGDRFRGGRQQGVPFTRRALFHAGRGGGLERRQLSLRRADVRRPRRHHGPLGPHPPRRGTRAVGEQARATVLHGVFPHLGFGPKADALCRRQVRGLTSALVLSRGSAKSK